MIYSNDQHQDHLQVWVALVPGGVEWSESFPISASCLHCRSQQQDGGRFEIHKSSSVSHEFDASTEGGELIQTLLYLNLDVAFADAVIYGENHGYGCTDCQSRFVA